MQDAAALFNNIQVVPVEESLASAALDGDGSLTQQVYVVLRRLAVELRLLPNQSLSEKDVADGLRVSRTPVREAFIRLAEDGVVRIVPKSGTYVATIDFSQAGEGYFVWGALESSCAGRLAEKHSLRDIGALRDLVGDEEDARSADDLTRFRLANNAFHDAIFDLAEFPAAKKLTDSAKFEVDRIRNVLQMHRLVPMEKMVQSHTDIVNSIAGGDAEDAERRMAEHLEELRQATKRMVEDREFQRYYQFLNQKRIGKRRPRGKRDDV